MAYIEWNKSGRLTDLDYADWLFHTTRTLYGAVHFLTLPLKNVFRHLLTLLNAHCLHQIFPLRKLAEVVPLLKEEDHETASNNCPLSLLPGLSKIMLESSPGSLYIVRVHVLLQAQAIIQPPEQKS